jgi:hypothetical protein
VPLVLRQQERREGAHAVHHAAQVHAEDPFPVLLGVLPRRAGERDAGVVADEVHAFQLRNGAPGEGFDFGGLRDIHAHREGLDAFARDRFLDASQILHIGQSQVHAFLGKGERHGLAQAAGRAGDRGDLPLERLHRPTSMNATA